MVQRLRAEREGRAFLAWTGLIAGTLGTVVTAAWPVLLPSTIDGVFDLTAQTASVSHYTLTVMSWVTAFGLPARPHLPGLDLLGLPSASTPVPRPKMSPDHHRRQRHRSIRPGPIATEWRGSRFDRSTCS